VNTDVSRYDRMRMERKEKRKEGEKKKKRGKKRKRRKIVNKCRCVSLDEFG
jgi:hypothetical protein